MGSYGKLRCDESVEQEERLSLYFDSRGYSIIDSMESISILVFFMTDQNLDFKSIFHTFDVSTLQIRNRKIIYLETGTFWNLAENNKLFRIFQQNFPRSVSFNWSYTSAKLKKSVAILLYIFISIIIFIFILVLE